MTVVILLEGWHSLKSSRPSQRFQKILLVRGPGSPHEISQALHGDVVGWASRNHDYLQKTTCGLPHLHHALFWLFHILIVAHHHCAWDKLLLYWVFKNRSVEGVNPSLGPTFSSTLRSNKFFWGLKLFCSDHQDSLYSTITIMFPWFESQVLLTSRIRNQIPLPCLTLSYPVVAAYTLKNSSHV